MTKPNFRVERNLQKRGIWPVAGIDEAGRGPLAGPVAAAAVVLDPRKLPRGLNDSKRLTPNERDHLFAEIKLNAIAVGFPFAGAAEIDRINIRQATFSAMRRALFALSVASRPRH